MDQGPGTVRWSTPCRMAARGAPLSPLHQQNETSAYAVECACDCEPRRTCEMFGRDALGLSAASVSNMRFRAPVGTRPVSAQERSGSRDFKSGFRAAVLVHGVRDDLFIHARVLKSAALVRLGSATSSAGVDAGRRERALVCETLRI